MHSYSHINIETFRNKIHESNKLFVYTLNKRTLCNVAAAEAKASVAV